MDRLTTFGLFAVTAMLVSYALDEDGPHFRFCLVILFKRSLAWPKICRSSSFRTENLWLRRCWKREADRTSLMMLDATRQAARARVMDRPEVVTKLRSRQLAGLLR